MAARLKSKAIVKVDARASRGTHWPSERRLTAEEPPSVGSACLIQPLGGLLAKEHGAVLGEAWKTSSGSAGWTEEIASGRPFFFHNT